MNNNILKHLSEFFSTKNKNLYCMNILEKIKMIAPFCIWAPSWTCNFPEGRRTSPPLGPLPQVHHQCPPEHHQNPFLGQIPIRPCYRCNGCVNKWWHMEVTLIESSASLMMEFFVCSWDSIVAANSHEYHESTPLVHAWQYEAKFMEWYVIYVC